MSGQRPPEAEPSAAPRTPLAPPVEAGPEDVPLTLVIGPEGVPDPIVVELVDPGPSMDTPPAGTGSRDEASPRADGDESPGVDGEPEAFVIRLDQFAGPLDLLLHLIREQDLDILDIPIGRITEQFLQAIEGIETRDLDNAGEFLEMAATLLRIKARMLLPRSTAGEDLESDPRYELVRRLLEYEHFREAARRMESAEAERARHYARGYVPPLPAPAVPEDVPVAWLDVWEAALGLEGRERQIRQHRVARRGVPVDRKMRLIVGALRKIRRVEFRDLVAPFGDRLHAVVTLLAGLELARVQRVSLQQREPFSPLWLFGGRRLQDDEDESPAPEPPSSGSAP